MRMERMLKGFGKVIPPGNSFIPSGKRFLIGTLLAVSLLTVSCDNQEQGAEKPTTEIDGLRMSEVGNVWKFKTDPTDVGIKEKWYTSQTDDSDWAQVRNNQDAGWEREHGLPF